MDIRGGRENSAATPKCAAAKQVLSYVDQPLFLSANRIDLPGKIER